MMIISVSFDTAVSLLTTFVDRTNYGTVIQSRGKWGTNVAPGIDERAISPSAVDYTQMGAHTFGRNGKMSE